MEVCEPSTSPKKITYRLARKHPINPLKPFIIPGSIEEDIDSPEEFLKYTHSKIGENVQRRNSTWKNSLNNSLNLMDAEDKVKLNNEKDKITKKLILRNKFGAHKTIESIITKKSRNAINATDEDVLRKYREIKPRNKLNTPNQSFIVKTIKPCDNIEKNRQSRCLYVNSIHVKNWRKYLNRMSKSLGRKAIESITTQSMLYREKVEKGNIMEMITPTAHIYADQNWHMNLRSTPEFKDSKLYSIPVGNKYGNLWMKITENPNKQEQIIRIPGIPKSKCNKYDKNPFALEKEKNAKERLKELMPSNNCNNLDEIIV